LERRAIDICGVVQGVGFRPFVHGLATRLNLRGFVANHGGRVTVEVEGDHDALDRFELELTASAPPLARIESIAARSVDARGDTEFRIASSRVEASPRVYISPDIATCDACLSELLDRHNRRYRYPFINCTACGPRLTIVTGSPYDRERTTMAGFSMCERCRSEYMNPTDRRFHAEPIACPDCGPRLEALDYEGRGLDADPIGAAASALLAGRIVAIKGLGGFHLACDARSDTAVAELRSRKHRDEKPFAVMAPDVDTVAALSYVYADELALLQSSARPIVLLRKRAGGHVQIAESIAPQSSRLGVLLPYTPLHHLLMSAVGGAPLVMTSGNRSDEPIAITNEDAITRLRGIADLFLTHDRDIRVRCEDSVMRVAGSAPVVIRRSRGYAPAPIALAFDCSMPILAVGGQLKNTFALGVGREAFVSHHAGDLDEWLALEAFERDVELYEQTFNVSPSVVAYDLHPDYASSRFAKARGGVTQVAVQHHHAHVAACMAEYGLEAPVIGIAWDGAGWGTDGRVWGGEFFVGDRRSVDRAAHFRYVALPGGDRAAREPWRMAVAHLHDAGLDDADALPGIAAAHRATVRQMIDRGLNTPMTSSAGRLTDAVAALCGASAAMTFEGQAAMWLESRAEESLDTARYPFEIVEASERGAPLTVDPRPLIRAVEGDRVRGVPRAVIARRFHTTLAHVVLEVARLLRIRTGIERVVLSGGVFLNGILTAQAQTLLASDRFEVYRHRVVSPGDGGLSLGQLAVAAASVSQTGER
jgi:hydrogenase maturation protein HypF